MKKRILYTLVILDLVLFLPVSCSQEEIAPYNGCKSGLFIQEVRTTDYYNNPIFYQDSISYSFANEVETVEGIYIGFNVRTMGDVVNYDRPYVLKIISDETTAIEGEDFDLENNEFMIKANKSSDFVRVYLKRTAKLRKTTLRIKLGVVANEYFDVPIDSYKNSSNWNVDGTINSATSFKIIFNEKYIAPNYWNSFGTDFFGDFTVARYIELNKVMGWTVKDWSNAGFQGAKVQFGRFDFAAKTFQKYLQEMANADTPVLDDDGSYIQLPAGYEVDYSHIGSNE